MIELKCSARLAEWLGAVQPMNMEHHRLMRAWGWMLTRDPDTGFPRFWPWQLSRDELVTSSSNSEGGQTNGWHR